MNDYTKLRPGPGARPDVVARHQRARICAALADLIAERGYEAVTVTGLTRLAHVSTRDFYRHYPSKEACLVAAYERAAACLSHAVGDAQQGAPDWRTGLERGLIVFAGAIAAQPERARLALIEAFAAGPAALCRMRSTIDLFGRMIDRGFASGSDREGLPPGVAAGIAGGIAQVARARLVAGREQELPGLVPPLLDWSLCFRCESAGTLRDLPPVSTRAQMWPALGRQRATMPAVRDERGRILEACSHLIGAEGYAYLTSSRIRAAAGVSRSCFKAHFEDHRDCLLATVEAKTDTAVKRASAVGAEAERWPAAVHRAITALCSQLGRDGALAKLILVEVFSPGPEGACCRERAVRNIAIHLRSTAPAHLRPSKLAAEASVGAAWDVMHKQVATGAGRSLPRVAPVLSFFVLAPAIGAKAAIEAIVREQARICASALNVGSPRPPIGIVFDARGRRGGDDAWLYAAREHRVVGAAAPPTPARAPARVRPSFQVDAPAPAGRPLPARTRAAEQHLHANGPV